MPNFNRLIGFDYGTKKIGLAYGQMVTRTARPLATIKNLEGAPNWPKIKTFIDEWQPEALIVGLPLNMDSTEQNITKLAKIFAKQLAKKFKLPAFLMDERLSTAAARSEIFEQGGYKALQEKEVDAHAAKIILESWISENALN